VTTSGKRQAGNGKSHNPSNTAEREIAFWRDKDKFGRGTQGLLVNFQLFDPDFFAGRFTWNDLGWLMTATYVAVHYKDFRILLTEDFFIVGLDGRGNGSSGSFKRTKAKFIEAGLLKKAHHGGRSGNEYIVADIITIPHTARDMNHHREAHMLTTNAREKLRRDLAKAQAELQRTAAEKRKRELEWAAACREAKRRGIPAPEFAEFQLG
jgi:hypothetical protein